MAKPVDPKIALAKQIAAAKATTDARAATAAKLIQAPAVAAYRAGERGDPVPTGTTEVAAVTKEAPVTPKKVVTPPLGGTPERPIGVSKAFVYNPTTKAWEQPAKPNDGADYAWDNNNGWVASTIKPGSTGNTTVSERTLAKDTFKNTLALFFGPAEMNKPWADGLYKSVSSFYKTGSTIDESLNLALQDVRNNKDMAEFTKRFKGVYALTDRLAGGEAIEVPTIAEYFRAESDMGTTMREAGLGDLATQDFLGDIIGRGKSVLEVGHLINDTFNAIDNAPQALKDTLNTYFPSVDRVSLAKALLMGKEGAAALDKQIKGISVLSAAGTQGVGIDITGANDIAAMGYDYNQALTGFGQVKSLERGTTLGAMSGINLTQQEIQGSVFAKNQAAKDKIAKIREQELLRWQGSSGTMASSLRGKRAGEVV